jgi:hypothetical protein
MYAVIATGRNLIAVREEHLPNRWDENWAHGLHSSGCQHASAVISAFLTRYIQTSTITLPKLLTDWRQRAEVYLKTMYCRVLTYMSISFAS